VKLDPKSAMPDAQSFATRTEVALAAPAEQPTGSKMAASTAAKPATTAALPATQDLWQTNVDSATPAIALKETSR
jgi:hypothetical protein